MNRGLAAALLLLAAVSPAAAQQPVEPVRLTVQPAGEPVPALKYRLLPELSDLSPGNAALLYQRAHSPEWMAYRREQDYYKKIDEWLQMPLKNLPRAEVRGYLPRAALSEIELAARREHCDWELTPRARKEGIGMLLPEVQTFREFATLLSLKARLEMAEGNYAQAIRTLETGFALGRHVANAPTLIHCLVGMAIVSVTAERLQELMQLPDAPNLYWTLTVLPRPFVDVGRSMQGERLFIDSLFPGIREALADPKTPPLAPEQVRGTLSKLNAELSLIEGGSGGKGLLFDPAAAAMVAKAYPEAKRFLLAQGRTPEQLEAMPMTQAVLMYEVYNYDRLFDEMLKWMAVPFWERRAGLQRFEEQLKQEKVKGPGTGTTLATLLLPAVSRVSEAGARTERRLAMLRTVEALRLYAAGHEGKLPAALSDIREVPVPVDPFTGKPFDYQVDGNRATLNGPPPPGERPTASNAMRYEVTVKDK